MSCCELLAQLPKDGALFRDTWASHPGLKPGEASLWVAGLWVQTLTLSSEHKAPVSLLVWNTLDIFKNPSADAGDLERQVWSLGWEDPWRRGWQPTPVFLPGQSHGQRTLEGYKSVGSQRVRHDRSDLAHTAHAPWTVTDPYRRGG